MEPAQENVADDSPQTVDAPEGNGLDGDRKDEENPPVPEPQVLEKSETEGTTVDAKKEEADEEALPPEVDSVQVPLHWHPKPCVHVTSIGGQVTEEELLPLFSKHGQISSVSFENERRDAAVIRYESYSGNAEELLTKIRQALNSTKLGDRTLIVEHFRPDSLLFIGNLTLDIDDALLQNMFESHGKIERAFVLRNSEGRSKGYGFVEYSLKSQATAAKMTMGNINMDGRVLRVEWSDCKKVGDMFSTVLFIDRLPRECLHIEQSLKDLFMKYGKIRDCHVAIGINQQYRGFAFIDFFHSTSADKAHQALDGHALEGSAIRVSFANPSKSAQSYKLRYGSDAAQAALGSVGKGGFAGPGMLMGPSRRGPSPMPLMPPRFMSPARPGMLGMGIGMQFGRGSLERGMVSPLLTGGGSMVGPNSGMAGRAPLLMGNMGARASMAGGGNTVQRLPFGQGSVSITPTAIAQVATAQAKAREEEAKARAEAAKQGFVKPGSAEVQSLDQYPRFQQGPEQNYYQPQQTIGTDQAYKQSNSVYTYQQSYQQQSAPQQASVQSQYQSWNQQPAQQTQQSYSTQNYSHPSQNYMQQQQQQQPYEQQQPQQEQTVQYTQHQGYYQHSTPQAQQYGYAQQYGNQMVQMTQTAGQQYQYATQSSQMPMQQNYNEQYMQQQQSSHQTAILAQATTGMQDAAQQQAYSAYYQQQAQAQAQVVTSQAGSVAAASSTPPAAQQSYEAQWAAYYASQAAYQQANYAQQQSYGGSNVPTTTYHEQTSTVDVGQKRTADQIESTPQHQASYAYAQAPAYLQQAGYQQQQQQQQQPQSANATAAYQQQPTIATLAYQQQQPQGAAGVTGYQQPGAAISVPSGTAASYLAPTTNSALTVYDQTISSVPDSYQQQTPGAAGTLQVGVQGQAAVASVYDISKRPRY